MSLVRNQKEKLKKIQRGPQIIKAEFRINGKDVCSIKKLNNVKSTIV